jgi:hypothetical protein
VNDKSGAGFRARRREMNLILFPAACTPEKHLARSIRALCPRDADKACEKRSEIPLKKAAKPLF